MSIFNQAVRVNRVAAQNGLTTTAVIILAAVGEGMNTPATIAEAANDGFGENDKPALNQQTIYQSMRKLASEGYLKATPNHETRSFNEELSAKGKKVVAQLEEAA